LCIRVILVWRTALPLVSLSYLGELSVLGHFIDTVPCFTLGQFIIPRWDISPRTRQPSSCSTIGQFIIPRWDISPRTRQPGSFS